MTMQAPSLVCLRTLRSLAFSQNLLHPECILARTYATRSEPHQVAAPRQPPSKLQPKLPTTPPPPSAFPLPRASQPPIDQPSAQPGFRLRGKSDNDEEFIPNPLSRPIGMPDPPRPGENMGLDERTLAQRREDFFNYDKHLKRRAQMTRQISKPYFRDWSNLRFHKGKIFKSNERLFRGDVSMWFPNFYGKPLSNDLAVRNSKDGYAGLGRDTCEVIAGKISIVSIISNMWAQSQVDSFCSQAQNPELHQIISQNDDLAQMVWINHETNFLKWWLIQLFRSNLRREKTVAEHARYFMVRRGVSDVMKEAIGLLNDKVGYVYLLDQEGRIRWAGSAEAEPSERESLTRGLSKLIQEARAIGDGNEIKHT